MLFTDIEYVERQVLWPGYLYMGDVAQLVGKGKVGKGRMYRNVVARLSNGWPMPPFDPFDGTVIPDGEYEWDRVGGRFCWVGVPMQAILICPEDNEGAEVKASLTAEGADQGMIDCMSAVMPRGDGDTSRSTFSMPRDFGQLGERIAELGNVGLVVIDPLMATATKTVSFNQQVRNTILTPMQELARVSGPAFWVVNHFTGGVTESNMIDHIAGSKGVEQALRVTSVITRDPARPEIRVMRTLSNNLGELPEAIRYILAGKDAETHVRWELPVASMTGPEARARVQAQVLAALDGAYRDGIPVTAQRLAAITNLAYDLVHQALVAAVRSGLADRRRGAFMPAPAIEGDRHEWR